LGVRRRLRINFWKSKRRKSSRFLMRNQSRIRLIIQLRM